MSNYTQTVCPLAFINNAAANGIVLGFMPVVKGPVLVQRLDAIVQTASSNASSKIVVETNEGTPRVIGELPIGTAVAGTQLSVTFADEDKRVESGIGIRVRQDGALTGGLLHWQLYTSNPNV